MVFEKLDSKHVLTGFDCGNTKLNEFLTKRAIKEQGKRLSTCYLCISDEGALIGYYTLSRSSVATASLGISRRKERDKVYPDIPVALLGRLAVDRKYKGQDYGGALIADMSTRLLAISHLIAINAIVVLPIDPQAVAFYTKFGFRQLHDHEMMFIPMQTIEEAIGIAKGGA